MKPFRTSQVWMTISLLVSSVSCAERDFEPNAGRKSLSQASTVNESAELGQGAENAEAEWGDETNEPIMVGGGFLACFIDEGEASAATGEEQLAVGCSIYAAADFRQRLDAQLVEIVEAELKLDAPINRRQRVDFVKTIDHPRWSWLANLPKGQDHYDLVLAVMDQQIRGRLPKLTIRVGDSLPPAIVEGSLQGEFKFRLSGTDLCISGNPVWSFSEGSAETDDMRIRPCAEALSFRLSPWLDGYRIHTFNPAPFSCEPRNYHQDFCERSCLDFENFGRGERLQLFGCTLSEPAQLARFSIVADRSVYLTFNNRFLVIDEGDFDLRTTADGRSHFEILTSRASP